MSYRTIQAQLPRSQSPKVRYYYYDIESWGLNPKNPAFIMLMPEKRYHSKMRGEYYFEDGKAMIEWVDNLPKSYRHVFYAHNGNAFDIYALFDTQELIDMKKLANPSTVFQFQYGKNVFFKDSYHLLSSPLSTYGAKGITPDKFINKLNPDFGNKSSISALDIEYCRQDVFILRDAIMTLRSLFREWVSMPNAELPLTAASMAYRVWCSNYWPKEWTWTGRDGKERMSATFNNEANECAKNAFFGGRVMVFPNMEGVHLKRVMSYDRNSMYSAVMLEKSMPNANVVFTAEPTIGRVHRLKDSGSPYWGEFVLESDIDAELFLPQSKNKKAEYLGKTFDGFLMWPELNYALDNGWHLREVRQLYRSESIELFNKYVSFFYGMRKEMKKNGDNRELFVKILLNSLFGKFGSKDRHERVEDSASITEIMKAENWREEFEVKTWGDFDESGFYLVSIEATIIPRCTFFPIAAAITSHARVNLQSTISTCKKSGFNVAYCDTDSVHLYGLKEGIYPPIDVGANLGQWGLERPKGSNDDYVDSAIYYERKAYTWTHKGAKVKIKHKGVSRSDGDLTKPQTNISVRKYKTAKRRGLESGVEVETVKKSKKWVKE